MLLMYYLKNPCSRFHQVFKHEETFEITTEAPGRVVLLSLSLRNMKMGSGLRETQLKEPSHAVVYVKLVKIIKMMCSEAS